MEDLLAVLAESGASRVFGVSVGALIALEAARAGATISQVAAYEPALLAQPDPYTGWVGRFDAEMAQGDTAAALVTSLYGLDLAPTAMKLMPRSLLEALTNKVMRNEDQKATSDTVTMRQLAPTLRYEGLLLAEMAGTAGTFADLDADVLLIGGAMKRPAFIRPAFDLLAQTLPHHRGVMIPGLGHGGSSDVGPANRDGKQERAAPVIRSLLPAMTETKAVVVNGLFKRYGTVTAVRGASFAVRQNEIFALLGPNGAGKTTILEILEGFRQS